LVGLKKPELYISWPFLSRKNELHLLVESKMLFIVNLAISNYIAIGFLAHKT
jgi:hypothetical protein